MRHVLLVELLYQHLEVVKAETHYLVYDIKLS